MTGRLRVLGVSAAAAVALLVSSCAPPPPAITATPNNVMVNTSVTLAGTGFPTSTTIALEECGATSWIVMANPCLASTSINVKTTASGTFSTRFKMVICPLVGPPPVPITARTCYVGEPTLTGIDTDSLTGAVKVIVTYP